MFGARIQADVQGVKGAKDQPKLSARVAVLDVDHPLAADANALGKRRLIEFEFLAPVAKDGAELAGVRTSMGFPNVNVRLLYHMSAFVDNFEMSAFGDNQKCHRSLT